MKIAYDYQIFSSQKYGGISRYFCELIKALTNKENIEFAIFAPLFINQYLERSIPKRNLKGKSVSLNPCLGVPQSLNLLNYLISSVSIRSFSPDIIHETYYSSRRMPLEKVKRVVTVHDMIHEKFPNSFDAVSFASKNKKEAIKRADHVICVSKQTQQDLIELLGVNKEKTSVIYHGIDHLNIIQNSSNKLFEGDFLLYVGNRSGYKNFLGFVEAFAISKLLLKNFKIVCFGGGRFSQSEKEFLEKKRVVLNKNIIQISGNDEILQSLYKDAKVFVFPSLYEGFGFPPLEAMRFSCPVACSKISSIPEIVGDAGVYFDPSNIENMTFVLENLVSDNGLRNDLIKKGIKRIENFSWEKCAQETLRVYQNLF